MTPTTATVYVSITGLRLKGPWVAMRFWWHAIRSMTQAQAAPGNISASARMINGVNHTLSVWEDKAAMRRFMLSGPHGKAMRAFPAIATGSTFGFETARDAVPDWDQVHALWLEHGVEYGVGKPAGK